MKVLIVSTVRFRLNGVTSVILNYYRNMERSDMQVDFVVHNEISEEYRQELEGNGSRIFRLPRKKNPLKYVWQLFRLVREEGYDVVHVHGNSAMMLVDMLPLALAGVPVRIAHGHSTSCSSLTVHRLLRPVFAKCCTHGFACSEQAGQFLFGKKPFRVVENGVELGRYAFDPEVRREFREKLGAGEKTVIGHIGNFFEVKNHTFLIDAFAELLRRDKNYLLVLISDGELMEMIREKVSALGISEQVLFLGKTTQVPGYLQAMDMLVLPSLYEGLPVVLVEAQAAGLPCLVSDRVSTNSDLTGVLQFLPIDDPGVWADAMGSQEKTDRAENCRLWHSRIGEAGYDIEKNAHLIKELYQGYLKEAR